MAKIISAFIKGAENSHYVNNALTRKLGHQISHNVEIIDIIILKFAPYYFGPELLGIKLIYVVDIHSQCF